jgi:hypothetical protein
MWSQIGQIGLVLASVAPTLLVGAYFFETVQGVQLCTTGFIVLLIGGIALNQIGSNRA